jgi:type IV pilus assembly protein PilW
MIFNRKSQSGFNLIELLIAMVLGLVVSLGIMQIFISAKNTYASQNAAAAIQEDGRFVLSKIIQEIRMVGMFGCLKTVSVSTETPLAAAFLVAQPTPITYTVSSTDGNTLTLITGDVGSIGGVPTWTIVSDCVSSALVYVGAKTPDNVGQTAFPVRKVVYTFSKNKLWTTLGTSTSVLINNVAAFDVLFGVASTVTDKEVNSYIATPTNPALIRTVRLRLTLSAPSNRVANQTFNVVAAIRNRIN